MKKILAVLLSVALLVTLIHFPIEAAPISELYLEMETFLTECALPGLTDMRVSEGDSIFIERPLSVLSVSGENQRILTDASYYPVRANNTYIGILGTKVVDNQTLFSFHEKIGIELNEYNSPKEVNLIFNPTGDYSFSVRDNCEADENINPQLYEFTYRQARYPNGVILNLPIVLQGNDLNGCWAACMSCIGYYHTGQSLSIAAIRAISGITETEGELNLSSTLALMPSFYSLYYSYTQSPPFSRMQYQTATLSQPMFLGCLVAISPTEPRGHMMVLKGYACGSSYNALYIMDPAQGNITVTVAVGDVVTFNYCGYLTGIIESGERVC